MSLFWTPEDAATIVEMPLEIITTGTVNKGNGIYLLKAGTPLDEYFAVSNDEDAVYLVAEDFYFYSNTPTQAKIVPLITAGYVDLNKAEAASGLTYTDDCIAALETAGITLVDGKLASSGGSGGGVLVVTIDADTGALDKTWQEIHDAGFAVTFGDGADLSYAVCLGIYSEDGEYGVSFWTFGLADPVTFITSSADGYPVLDS